MFYISIITRSAVTVPDYLQFGAEIVEAGTNEFGDTCLIVRCPERRHAEYNERRLQSGMHGACFHENIESLNCWKQTWKYTPNAVQTS